MILRIGLILTVMVQMGLLGTTAHAQQERDEIIVTGTRSLGGSYNPWIDPWLLGYDEKCGSFYVEECYGDDGGYDDWDDGDGEGDESAVIVIDEQNCDNPTTTPAVVLGSPVTGFRGPTVRARFIEIDWVGHQRIGSLVGGAGGATLATVAVIPADAPVAVPLGTAATVAGFAQYAFGTIGQMVDEAICVPSSTYSELEQEINFSK